MEEKQKNKKNLITKERVIVLIIGLLIGILLTCVVGFCMDYFAKSAGMAKLRYGEQTLATVSDKAISAETIYESVKKTEGLTLLLNEVDRTIVSDMYTLTEKEEEEVKEQADYYIDYYVAMGISKEEFLTGNGFSTYEDFLDDIRLSEKLNKYLYDYLEGKLEKGAVQKYYDENKDSIETYDSEHILVKVTEDVTDEQALALANEIITKLNEGKSFEEVVKEYEDKITHEELGYQGKSANLEKTYIDELIALKDGEYSKTPVKTSYGYHIVHRLKTATFEDLRETVIEILAEDLLTADTNITSKAFVELREEKNLAIFDEELKKQYEEYCNTLYETTTEQATETIE